MFSFEKWSRGLETMVWSRDITLIAAALEEKFDLHWTKKKNYAAWLEWTSLVYEFLLGFDTKMRSSVIRMWNPVVALRPAFWQQDLDGLQFIHGHDIEYVYSYGIVDEYGSGEPWERIFPVKQKVYVMKISLWFSS